MLKKLFTDTLRMFDTDYKHLCQKHYPTIHNRGMSPKHLSSAFNRRLQLQCKNDQYTFSLNEFSYHPEHHIYIYHIYINNHEVWCIYPLFSNAKTEAKIQILNTVENLLNLNVVIDNAYIALLCDHWFDRSKSSKELYSWWVGSLPLLIKEYNQQGVHHLESEEKLTLLMKDQFNLACIDTLIHHPLESYQHHALLKYYLCFSLFKFNTA